MSVLNVEQLVLAAEVVVYTAAAGAYSMEAKAYTAMFLGQCLGRTTMTTTRLLQALFLAWGSLTEEQQLTKQQNMVHHLLFRYWLHTNKLHGLFRKLYSGTDIGVLSLNLILGHHDVHIHATGQAGQEQQEHRTAQHLAASTGGSAPAGDALLTDA